MEKVNVAPNVVIIYEVSEAKAASRANAARLENVINRTAKKIARFNEGVLTGRNQNAGERLNNKLKQKKFERIKPPDQQQMTQDDIANLIEKNFIMNSDSQVKSNYKQLLENEIIEYVPGTSIYFGSSIALQAKHGGYLSYNDALNIKASAHKILQQTRFLVQNADDLTDIGILRYGDAIWLQAGQFDVLGAHYSGGPIIPGAQRTIRPGLINSRKQNIFKAQQYGRWIVLNSVNPIETIGQPVQHYDSIMLEQEWYFLASSNPYESSMHRNPENIDDVMKSGKVNLDLFSPGDDCFWKIVLVNLPRDDMTNEKERQKLAQYATDQIKQSKKNRRLRSRNLTIIANETQQTSHLDEKLMESSLKHKKSEEESNKNLAKRYIDKVKMNWAARREDLNFLSRIYGKDSAIVKNKELALRLITEGRQFVSTKVQIEKLKSKVEIEDENYWNLAAPLLMDTKAYLEMPNSLLKYYEIDMDKKIRAARVIQRMARKFLDKTFNFDRSMRHIDKKVDGKVQHVVRDQRKNLIISRTRSNLIHPQTPLSTDISVDDILFFKTQDSQNKLSLAQNKRAQTISKDLDEMWETNAKPVTNAYFQDLAYRSAEDDSLYTRSPMDKSISNRSLVSPLVSPLASPAATPSVNKGWLDHRSESFREPMTPTTGKIASETSSSPNRPNSAGTAVSATTGVHLVTLGASASSSSIQSPLPSAPSTPNPIGTPFSMLQDTTPLRSPFPEDPQYSPFSNASNTPFPYPIPSENGLIDARDDSSQSYSHSHHLPRSYSMTAVPNARDSSTSQRPHTSNGKADSRDHRNHYGLPSDVLDNPLNKTSLKTGMKFLRLMSHRPQIYSDINVIKKSSLGSSAQIRSNSTNGTTRYNSHHNDNSNNSNISGGSSNRDNIPKTILNKRPFSAKNP